MPPGRARCPNAGGQSASPRSTGIYYLLAILAGLSINIMPCVLPVLPLIMMRLIGQADHSSGRRIASGLAFCAGVVFFFAAFAFVSAIINVTTGAVLDLNSLFRYPAAVIVLFLAIVFFALAMLDIVTLSLPSSVATGEAPPITWRARRAWVSSPQSSARPAAGPCSASSWCGHKLSPCSSAAQRFS